jgi:type I restriction enzyme S subunit
VWRGAIDPCAHQNHLIKVRFDNGVNEDLVKYWLLSPAGREHVTRAASSTSGLHTLSISKVEVLPVRLGPAAEQSRIVDSVDSYLTRLDAAIATLEAAQTKLKAYRASVLKAAVEGRLVPTEAELARAEKRDFEPADVLLERILAERRRRWEEAELAKLKAAGKSPRDDKWKAKYEEPEAPDVKGLPELPEGWCWVQLDHVSDIQLGQQRAPVHAAAEEQLPYVRAANITWDGLDISDVKTMGFPNPGRYRLRRGDVLLSEASGSPMEAGKPAIWRDEIPDACYQKTLIRVRVINGSLLLPEFVRLVFLRDCVTGKFARLAPGVGIVHLTAERMLVWAVPLPPVAEQERIVDEVERLESVQRNLKSSVAQQSQRAGRLRQSILKWAFEGKLVDQDPNDEPAEKLLERIRAERANAGSAKKSPRGNAAAPT